jgi:hypothetical protein
LTDVAFVSDNEVFAPLRVMAELNELANRVEAVLRDLQKKGAQFTQERGKKTIFYG